MENGMDTGFIEYFIGQSFSKSKDIFFFVAGGAGVPYKDCNILGPLLGPPYAGKLPHRDVPPIMEKLEHEMEATI